MRHIVLVMMAIAFFSCTDNKTKQEFQTPEPIKTNTYKPNLSMDTINTDRFWALVDKAVNVAGNNPELKEQFLIEELAKLSPEEITNFEIAFRKCVIDADDFKVMAAQKIIEGSVSDDSYLYFRCWLIGQGKSVYSEALKNPDSLAGIVNKDEFCDFGSLISVATNAYAQKTGKEEDEDETFPRNIAFNMGLDYDFGAPPTKGIDWTEEKLPSLLPKLWAKFN